jgi:signal peptidase II
LTGARQTRSVVVAALVLAGVVLVLDQVTKALIVHVVMDPPRVIEVTPFFNLVLTYNKGITFGLLRGHAAWQPWLLAAVSAVVVIGLLIWLPRTRSRLHAVGIGLVAGGATGNVIDRLTTVGVVDFLDFHIAGWHWWAFNVADSAIVIGVGLFLWDGLFNSSGDTRAWSEKTANREEQRQP